MASIHFFFLSFSLFFHSLSHSATITLQNNCTHTIWPAILSGAGTAPLSTTGFSLLPSASSLLSVPTSWSGRIWARTYCSTDPSSGRFSCATADCGSGSVECGGACAAPPATLAEFTLNGGGGFDFYDVSLVDGFNIAMQIVAVGGKSGNCTTTGCIEDLNGECPGELRVVMSGGNRSVACKSGCVAFGKAEYCCSGVYANPNTCKPSNYSKYFKNNCPLAYSYAFDDGTSTFTCAAAIEHATPHVTHAAASIARVIMWEDPMWSIKVLAVSGGVAIIGNIFSDLTLIFLLTVAVFVLPKAYQQNKEKVDEHFASLKGRIEGVVNAVPNAGAVKKTQ